MKIIKYDPKTGVSITRQVSPAEAEEIRKQLEGKFSETDGEPMFLKKFREALLQKSLEASR